jgi:uroporphyrinogen-III synthase
MSPAAVIHTGPADRADAWLAALRRAGFEARALPAIECRTMEPDAATLEAVAAGAPYGLAVVTSRRAASALPWFSAWLGSAEVAAVGASTAKACAEHGFTAQWVGSGGARPFLEALAARVDLGGRAVLHPRGDLAGDGSLPELAGRGARVIAPNVYRTLPVEHPAARVLDAVAGAMGVTFTSPSGVRSFAAAADAAGAGAQVRRSFAATLGAVTEDAARRAGFQWRGVARRPEPEAVADLFAAAFEGLGTTP